jgi:hypothetical protein
MRVSWRVATPAWFCAAVMRVISPCRWYVYFCDHVVFPFLGRQYDVYVSFLAAFSEALGAQIFMQNVTRLALSLCRFISNPAMICKTQEALGEKSRL